MNPFSTLSDEQLNAYIQSPGVNFSPAGMAPFNRQQVLAEINRRRGIALNSPGLTPEQVIMGQRGRWNEIPESGSRQPPLSEFPVDYIPPSRNPVPGAMGANPEDQLSATPIPPTEALPTGEQFGPPIPAAARQPAGGPRRGGGGAATQPLPVPPTPPGNEQFGPDASLAPTAETPMSARDQNKWLAVLQAGLGMLAADGPNAAANIGKGGMAGVTAFQDWERTRKAEEARDRQLDIMDEYRKGTIDVARQNADTRILDAENRIRIAEMRVAQAGAGQAARAATLELQQARLDYARERDEANRRQRENERDPGVRAQQQWSAQRAQMVERAMAMKDEVGRPMFATPEALNRYVDGVVGPQPGAVPRAVRTSLSQGYDAFMNGSLPADKWQEMLTKFRNSFNVDPNIYLRD